MCLDIGVRYNGYTIRALRRVAGISQTVLAETVGITQGHLSNIEAGRHQPGDDLALALGKALGIDDLRAIQCDPGPVPVAVLPDGPL